MREYWQNNSPQRGEAPQGGSNIDVVLESGIHASSRTYALRTETQRVGSFTVGRNESNGDPQCALSWTGKVDFANLNGSLRGLTKAAFGQPINIDEASERKNIYATLSTDTKSITNHGKGEQVFSRISQTTDIQGSLSDPTVHNAYEKALANPDRLISLDLLMVNPADESEVLILTAESFNSKHNQPPRLTIQQDGPQVWDEKVMEWVFSHHLLVKQNQINIPHAAHSLTDKAKRI